MPYLARSHSGSRDGRSDSAEELCAATDPEQRHSRRTAAREKLRPGQRVRSTTLTVHAHTPSPLHASRASARHTSNAWRW